MMAAEQRLILNFFAQSYEYFKCNEIVISIKRFTVKAINRGSGHQHLF